MHHVQQWKESGLTQISYSEKIGVKRSTFANWVSRSKERTATGFVAITSSPAPVLVSQSIEIMYPNGVRLKTDAFDIRILSELIRCYQCSA